MFEKNGRYFTGGEDLQLGDIIRLVDKKTLRVDGNSWDEWGAIVSIREHIHGTILVKIEGRPEIRMHRSNDGYSLFWEVQPRTRDYKEDQPQEDDDDV